LVKFDGIVTTFDKLKMNLTKEQAVYCASVFSDYFDRFSRIDEYMREQKLNSMAERPFVLPGMGPEEDLFTDFNMSPADMEFEVMELPQERWDIYLNMISFNRCAIMGFVIVPAQPFGYNYLGGKLMAAICTTHEVREMLDKKYNMTTCLFETTSLYGSTKAVSQYDGMKPLIRHKGLTDSDFLPMLHGETYTNLKEYIENIIGEPLAPEGASSRKLKISNAMVSLINVSLRGTPEGDKFKRTIENAKNLNEQKRYYVSDYGFSNMVDYVNGKTTKLVAGENYEKFHLENVIEWWRKKAVNRYETLKTENRLRTEIEVWTGEKEIDIIR